MRVLCLFNVDFCAWPLHILERLRRRRPGLTVEGLVVLDRTVTEMLRRQRILPFESLHCLSDLEAKWLATPNAGSRLARQEILLGRSQVAEIAIADRELSAGWVSGGTSPMTPLRRAALQHENWQAYLAGLIDFFVERCEKAPFDLVFSYPVQDGASVTAGIVAGHFGIPFLSPKAIGFQAKTCLFDDVKTMQPCFRHVFRRAEREPQAISVGSYDEAKRVLSVFRERPTPPDYMSLGNEWTYQAPGFLLTASLIKRILTRRRPISLRYPYPFARLKWEYAKWFGVLRDQRNRRFQPATALAGIPYAYFPLHYEPEASTLVSAPWNTNQLAAIELAAKAIPASWLLAVKEHIPMLGRRPHGFYDRLAAMPKVILVSPFADSFELNRSAKMTVTITGTAGLEAVLLQKPVVFLGESPVQILERGFVYCPEATRLPDAIAQALATPPASDLELVRFLAALGSQSVDVPSRLIWGGTGVVTSEVVAGQGDALERFVDLILDALKERSFPIDSEQLKTLT